MNYKLFIIFPIILLVLSISYLFVKTTTEGLDLDIDLKGGTQIIVETSIAVSERDLENILNEYDVKIRTARGLTAYSVFIEFDASIKSEDVLNELKENDYDFSDYSIQTVGPALGEAFFHQAIIVLVLAFIFMIITVFIIFKVPLISLYISLSPLFDIIEALALSQLLGIKLSLASFAALLMLIGYSVDDDVMVTTRVLKGTVEMKEKLRNGFKTSLTTTTLTIVALVALYLVSVSSVIIQIASVLLIGLLVDLQNTWLFAVTLLRWHVERKEK